MTTAVPPPRGRAGIVLGWVTMSSAGADHHGSGGKARITDRDTTTKSRRSAVITISTRTSAVSPNARTPRVYLIETCERFRYSPVTLPPTPPEGLPLQLRRSMSVRSMRVAIVALCLVVMTPLVAAAPASAETGHFTGRTANGQWVVDVPQHFNGTLLLWSHGYTFTRVGASDAPSAATRDGLLEEGYALAGSSYAGGGAGWAVNQGVRAGVELISIAKAKVGTGRVERVYAWGNSLGGLITETLAQRHPGLVSGVAPLCGVLAGTNRNLDLALDVEVAVKALFYPNLRL